MDNILFVEGAVPSNPDGQYATGEQKLKNKKYSINFGDIRYTLSNEDIKYGESEGTKWT